MSFLSIIAMLFRLTGDLFHILTVLILCKKIKQTRSVSGLSFKTQILYMLVFATRYIDLFEHNFKSALMVYNNLMKVVFLSFQGFLVYLIKVRYFYSYDAALDSFNPWTLIVPSAGLSLFLMPKTVGTYYMIREYLWTFSVVLEAVSIIPQLFQLQESGDAEALTSQYVLCLGMYRLFYVFNWIFKILSKRKVNHILLASGIIQSLLYVDFFVVYYKHIFLRKKENLPKNFK